MGGSSPQVTTSQQQTQPWAASQPYLTDLMGQAQAQQQKPVQPLPSTFAPLNGLQNAGASDLTGFALDPAVSGTAAGALGAAGQNIGAGQAATNFYQSQLGSNAPTADWVSSILSDPAAQQYLSGAMGNAGAGSSGLSNLASQQGGINYANQQLAGAPSLSSWLQSQLATGAAGSNYAQNALSNTSGTSALNSNATNAAGQNFLTSLLGSNNGLSSLSGLAGTGGADWASQQLSGANPLTGLAASTQGGVDALSNSANNTQGADFISSLLSAAPGSDPNLDALYKREAEQVGNQVNSQFSMANRTGSGAHQDIYAKDMNDLANEVYGGAYQSDLSRQAGLAQGLLGNSQSAAGQLAGINSGVAGQLAGQQQSAAGMQAGAAGQLYGGALQGANTLAGNQLGAANSLLGANNSLASLLYGGAQNAGGQLGSQQQNAASGLNSLLGGALNTTANNATSSANNAANIASNQQIAAASLAQQQSANAAGALASGQQAGIGALPSIFSSLQAPGATLEGVGATYQQQAQQQLQDLYNQFMYSQQQPWSNLQNYSGIITGLGGLGSNSSGTSSVTPSQPSTLQQLLGAGAGIAGIASLM